MTIVYLAPDCTDSAVKKRAHGFLRLGHELACFSFRRNRYQVGFAPDWPNIEFGTSEERRLVSRVFASLWALRVIFAHRKVWRRASVLYARNLDLALLALIGRIVTWSRAPLVYEVLDIHPTLLKDGWKGRVARWLERRVLRHCRLLVVSSPEFVDRYFLPVQRYSGESCLLENKWPQEGVFEHRPDSPRRVDDERTTWTIGWFGNLRCEESLRILTELAVALPDRVRIVLRGYPSLLGAERLRRAIEGCANIEFAGEYAAPEDLPRMYEKVHFNWCADFSGDENGRWLIPNRIYEGGFFGVPAVAIDGHYTGRLVQQRGLGVVVGEPYVESLRRLLLELTADSYADLRRRIEEQPIERFVDCGDLRQVVEIASSPR